AKNKLKGPPKAADPKHAKNAAERAVDLVAIFAELTAEEHKTLAAKAGHKHYEGEALVEPGTVLRSLFIIGGGVVSLTAVVSEGEIEVLRAGPAGCFGRFRLPPRHPPP